jgi:acyl-CoA synthetase (AMP-forming)/AMP-acid ligase II
VPRWSLRARPAYSARVGISSPGTPAPGTPEHRADTTPDGVCLADAARRLTWRAWDRRADELAAGLEEVHGVSAGDRVAWRLPNRAELFVLTLALAKLGAGEVAVGPWLSDDAAGHVLTDSQAVLLVSEQADPPWATAPVLAAADLHATAVAGAPRRLTGTRPPAATVTYSAGRSGLPRGAVREFTPEHLRAAAPTVADLVRRLGLRQGERHLLAAPAAHPTALLLAQLTLALGGAVVCLDPFEPRTALALIEEHAITSTFLLPPMLAALAALPDAAVEAVDVTSLEAVVAGGGPIRPDLREQAIDLLGEDCLFVAYGTAHTGTVALLHPDEQHERPDAVGRPLHGVAVRTRGDELQVRSPLALRRWQDGEAAPSDGFVATGDRGHLDGDGLLVLE